MEKLAGFSRASNSNCRATCTPKRANVTLPSYNNGTYTPLSIAKDSNWGQPTGTLSPLGPGGPRVIQLAAKVYF